MMNRLTGLDCPDFKGFQTCVISKKLTNNIYDSSSMKLTKILFVLLCLSAVTLRAQVVINEFSAANLTLIADNYGKHEDWVELYNTSAAPVNIGNWHLSDDKDEPTKWQFPANLIIAPGGFLLVWCSGRNEAAGGEYHTNFKITQTKTNAENITLSNAAGLIVDTKKVKKLQLHHSQGRKVNGGSDWGICKAPTPAASNNTVPFYEDYASKPNVDVEAGFYENGVVVTLSSDEPGVTIRYTFNGNEPTATSQVYSAPLNFTSTKVLKAIAVPADTMILPSFTEYNTYFINVDHTLPVLSVSGTQLTALANGNQGLRPKGSLEYFGKDKIRSATVTGELNSHGQDSWVNDQRSIDWVSRDEMGDDSAIKEALFPAELTDRDEFQRIILRAAGDDNYPDGSNWPSFGPKLSAHLRDAYTHNLAKRGGMHLDVRSGTKAIIYLNGQYWGVYDLRELPDDHDFTEYNYDQGKFDLQYLLTWGDTWAEYWDTYPENPEQEWNLLVDFIKNNDMADPANFEVVDQELDYKSLADYMIVNSFANASDWLNYNTGWWRGMNPEGGHRKWGYILWDLDATYAYYINYTGILDTGATAAPCNVEEIDLNNWGDPQPQNHLDVLNTLKNNPGFNQYWITRQADMINTVFSCENMLTYLDSVVASIQPEMPKHITRWGGNMAQWESNVARLRSFIERRCEYLSGGLAECYNLTGPYPVVFRTEPSWGGSIQVNTLTYNQLPVETNVFGGIDLLLDATPINGYTFDHWESTAHTFADSSLAANQLLVGAPDTITAYFNTGTVGVTPVTSGPAPLFDIFPAITRGGFTVSYLLPEATTVSVRLFDLSGKEVADIVPAGQRQGQGSYQMRFEGAGLVPGNYVARCVAGNTVKTFKIVVLGKE